MPSIRSLSAFLTLACAVSLSSVSVSGQENKPVSEPAPLLRRIVFKHPGCVTCNDSILDQEQQYLNEHVKELPRVETVYQQKAVDEMKQTLEDFWRKRGIDVQVDTRLTQIPNVPRSAVLEIQVCRKY